MSDAGSKSVARSHDRRSKPRICVPFKAKVHGVDNKGEEYNVETVLDNVSGDGLYMRMMLSIEEGTSLSIEVRLRPPSRVTQEPPRILLEGTVLRIEKKVGGVCGVAVAIEHVRFA